MFIKGRKAGRLTLSTTNKQLWTHTSAGHVSVRLPLLASRRRGRPSAALTGQSALLLPPSSSSHSPSSTTTTPDPPLLLGLEDLPQVIVQPIVRHQKLLLRHQRRPAVGGGGGGGGGGGEGGRAGEQRLGEPLVVEGRGAAQAPDGTVVLLAGEDVGRRGLLGVLGGQGGCLLGVPRRRAPSRGSWET